jgi:hypothetical protein
MMPHQRYVHDVAGELDPATGLRWYDLVIETVPRQTGKTQGVEAQMSAASRRPEPDGRPTRRTCLYLAQDRLMARERLVVELGEQKMIRNPALPACSGCADPTAQSRSRGATPAVGSWRRPRPTPPPTASPSTTSTSTRPSRTPTSPSSTVSSRP